MQLGTFFGVMAITHLLLIKKFPTENPKFRVYGFALLFI